MAKKKLEILSVSKFADLMGVASNTVTKWIDTGKITAKSITHNAAGKPQIIVEYAVPELKANEDPSKTRRTRTGLNIGGNTRPEAKVAPAPSTGELNKLLNLAGINEDGDLLVNGISIMDAQAENYGTAKIQEQIAKAELAKLTLKEKRGMLVDKEKQDKQMALLGSNLKMYLNTLADRVAAPVHAAARNGTELDTRNIIHTAIEYVLEKFAGKIWE